MKWFKHPSNLRNSPIMVSIKNNLGIEAYGQAVILLEVFAEHCGEVNKFRAAISTKTPTDERFWAYEFGQSASETNQLLRAFNAVGLIQYNDDDEMECPLLETSMDEYTARRAAMSKK
jgi:hypothetical protein